MIDLHSHILPAIDDGSPGLSTSLDMARAWAGEGVTTLACTPHILPGLFNNSGPDIRRRVAALQERLDEVGIPLKLVTGADNHVTPDFVAGLRRGQLLTLADSRYVLVEPPHHTAPPRLGDLLFGIMAAGFTPVLTHPERLTWIEGNYGLIKALAKRGVWMQITAGALTGSFGRRPKYWGERMLCEGLADIIATDAHNMDKRPPDLSQGYACAARLVGNAEAEQMVLGRPRAILEDRAPSNVSRSKHTKPSFEEGMRANASRGVPQGGLASYWNRGSRHFFGWMQRRLP
jgi:protein-tyrosine phosphatase